MAEWSKALGRFEWSALANSGVLGSNPAQVSDCQLSCLVWAGTLVALYKREGLFVIE